MMRGSILRVGRRGHSARTCIPSAVRFPGPVGGEHSTPRSGRPLRSHVHSLVELGRPRTRPPQKPIGGLRQLGLTLPSSPRS